jgi:hypothetical protein
MRLWWSDSTPHRGLQEARPGSHVTEQLPARVLVSDTVVGISFPRYLAASTLNDGGTRSYLISDEASREFDEQHG